MNSIRKFFALAALVLPLASFAQCENETSAMATAKSLQQELGALKQSQEAGLKEVVELLDDRAQELGWTQERRAAAMNELTNNGQYVYFELQKQQQMLQVAAVKLELQKPEVKNDAVSACLVGLKFGPPMRKIAEIGEKEIQYLKKRVADMK